MKRVNCIVLLYIQDRSSGLFQDLLIQIHHADRLKNLPYVLRVLSFLIQKLKLLVYFVSVDFVDLILLNLLLVDQRVLAIASLLEQHGLPR